MSSHHISLVVAMDSIGYTEMKGGQSAIRHERRLVTPQPSGYIHFLTNVVKQTDISFRVEWWFASQEGWGLGTNNKIFNLSNVVESGSISPGNLEKRPPSKKDKRKSCQNLVMSWYTRWWVYKRRISCKGISRCRLHCQEQYQELHDLPVWLNC